MISRTHGRISFLCDRGCNATTDTGEGVFAKALAIAKARGWRVYGSVAPGRGYVHVCPSCTRPR